MTISQASPPNPSVESFQSARPPSQRTGAVVRQATPQQEGGLSEPLESAVRVMIETLDSLNQEDFPAAYKDYAQAIEKNITGKDDPNIKKLILHIKDALESALDIEASQQDEPDYADRMNNFRLLTEPVRDILSQKTFYDAVIKGMKGLPKSLTDKKMRLFATAAIAYGLMAWNTDRTSPDDMVSRLSGFVNTVVGPALLWPTLIDKNADENSMLKKMVQSTIPAALNAGFVSTFAGNKDPNTLLGIAAGAGVFAGGKVIEYAYQAYKNDNQTAAASEEDTSTDKQKWESLCQDIAAIADGSKKLKDIMPHLGFMSEAKEKVIAGLGTSVLKASMVGYAAEFAGNTTTATATTSFLTSMAAIPEYKNNSNMSAQDITALGSKAIFAAALLFGADAAIPKDQQNNNAIFWPTVLGISALVILAARASGPATQKAVAFCEGDAHYRNVAEKYQTLQKRSAESP